MGLIPKACWAKHKQTTMKCDELVDNIVMERERLAQTRVNFALFVLSYF